jgi:hypothetical protein
VTAGSERVRDEWLRRVEAEYRSAAITHHLVHWLIQIAASPDLIAMGLRIVKDELAHATLSFRTYRAAGGNLGPTLARETLALARHDDEPIEHDVARTCVEVFCLGETVAVPLFNHLRKDCSAPSARRALDRILKDEVRHRDFGWLLLPWLLEQTGAPNLRALIDAELPAMLRRQRASYAPAGAEKETKIAPEDRAWGLMPAAKYGEVLARAVERDYAPRFSRLGFDVRAAWQRSLG